MKPFAKNLEAKAHVLTVRQNVFVLNSLVLVSLIIVVVLTGAGSTV